MENDKYALSTMHSPVSALRYMSSVFECSLSIDCFVGYGSICNMPGILSTCQNILNKKKNFIMVFVPVVIMNVFLII